MFEVRDNAGLLIFEYHHQEEAIKCLVQRGDAHHVVEVVETRKVIAIKESALAPRIQEEAKAPF